MQAPDARTRPEPREGRDRPRTAVRGAVDFAGPLAFFLVYVATRNMMFAAWALLAGAVLSLATDFALDRRLAPLPLTLGCAAVLLAGLALLTHDPSLVKLETSLHNAAIGGFLLAGLALGYNPLRLVLGRFLFLTEAGWWTLCLRIGLYHLAAAALNEIVWRTQPDAVWAVFKFPVLTIIHLLFYATQIPLIRSSYLEAKRERTDAEPA